MFITLLSLLAVVVQSPTVNLLPVKLRHKIIHHVTSIKVWVNYTQHNHLQLYGCKKLSENFANFGYIRDTNWAKSIRPQHWADNNCFTGVEQATKNWDGEKI